jgi:hypothetical protein
MFHIIANSDIDCGQNKTARAAGGFILVPIIGEGLPNDEESFCLS